VSFSLDIDDLLCDNIVFIGLITPVMMQISPTYELIYSIFLAVADDTYMLYRITFGTFSLACFLSYLWATYLVPETANVSLEEMDAVFDDRVGTMDKVVRGQVCFLFPPSLRD